jgi:hypothetical protein
MTSLEELPTTDASLTPNISVGLFSEIFTQASWRLYLSTEHIETESLVRRFLSAHAQIPGGISDRLTGVIPIDTFRFTVEGRLHEGFLFLNGAVVKISNDQNQMVLLFIDEETSAMWGYPPKFLSYEERIKQTRRNENLSDQQVDTNKD